MGPDLTGTGRKDLDYLLSNLIEPSAIVDPAYHLTTVLTVKGRLLNGYMIQQSEHDLLLRTQDAQIRLLMDDIEQLHTAPVSMMPDGLLRNFSKEQVRDLLIYLRDSVR